MADPYKYLPAEASQRRADRDVMSGAALAGLRYAKLHEAGQDRLGAPDPSGQPSGPPVAGGLPPTPAGGPPTGMPMMPPGMPGQMPPPAPGLPMPPPVNTANPLGLPAPSAAPMPMPQMPVMAQAAGGPGPIAGISMPQTPEGPGPEERNLLPGVIPYEDIIASYILWKQRGGQSMAAAPTYATGGMYDEDDEFGDGPAEAPMRSGAFSQDTGVPQQSNAPAGTDAPADFIDWLNTTAPEDTNDFGQALLGAYQENPGEAGTLYHDLELAVKQFPEMVPADLKAICKGSSAEGEIDQVGYERPDATPTR